MKSKVLLIGIDGCCPDAIKQAQTPVIDELCGKGAYNFNMHTEKITLSGPSWTSILTGYSQETHGIIDNKFEGFKELPTFLDRLKKVNPDFRTASVVAWPPINHKICTKVSYKFENSSDVVIVKEVQRLISEENFNAIFVHLDKVDATGHQSGYESLNYINAVTEADDQIGKILSILQEIENPEDWLIVITTDHGGWKKDHKENADKIRRTFCIFSGDNIKPGEFDDNHYVTDITPTILKYFELEPGLDGKVIDVFK
jgi:predicted AlkP superfamily pyrophosphatase or phosphodiesterase